MFDDKGSFTVTGTEVKHLEVLLKTYMIILDSKIYNYKKTDEYLAFNGYQDGFIDLPVKITKDKNMNTLFDIVQDFLGTCRHDLLPITQMHPFKMERGCDVKSEDLFSNSYNIELVITKHEPYYGK